MIIYYTDWHDVDEETRTITALGGYWFEYSFVGVMNRDVANAPTGSQDFVASSNMENVRLY